jgi:Tol biopolymer transport system component
MRDGHPEVYIIGADGSGVTNITNDPSQNYTVGGP